VDKRELIKSKKRQGKGSKHGKESKKAVAKDASSGSENEEDKEMDDASVDAELEKELEEDLEAKNPEMLDETVFNKFATGELDLPEEEDDADLLASDGDDIDDAAAAEDSELEAYYEELGIDVAEMHEKRTKKSGEAQYKR